MSPEEELSVTCPYCGQDSELVLDASLGNQSFVTDCEVCCRPMEIRGRCESGEILSLEVGEN